MIITCPNCDKRFKIDPTLIPVDGRDLKCGSCDHVWLYKVEDVSSVPLTINDNVDGGLVRFVLPNKGFLSANTCIVLPAECVKECYQYAPNAGVYSLLKVARLSCGDQVISEIQNVGQLLAQRKLSESQEVREKMSQVKEGINFSLAFKAIAMCIAVGKTSFVDCDLLT